jgi:hypothetical protein
MVHADCVFDRGIRPVRAQTRARTMFACSARFNSAWVVIKGLRRPFNWPAVRGVAPGVCGSVSATVSAGTLEVTLRVSRAPRV